MKILQLKSENIMKINIGLFKNKFKRKENQPDYRASFKSGEEWVDIIAGWISTTKNGDEYISLSIDADKLDEYSKKRGSNTSKSGSSAKTSVIPVDDIPF